MSSVAMLIDRMNLNDDDFSYITEADTDTPDEKQTKDDKTIAGKPVSQEVIENSKNKKIIGKIGGIGADSNVPTRNNRRYPIELWRNVEQNDYFIEGMENRTIIGEADHPEERLDYSVKEGAVILTKYEIQQDGKVYTEFDILDTPAGRTVKTYFDAGCRLGVSSRGLGEEVVRDGETIIDPDTYQFYCFDVVAFPAVKSARMELIESTSPKRLNLINSIRSEIKKCQSLDEVLCIESISKDVDLYLDEIKEAVEIRKDELSKEDNKGANLEQVQKDINELKNSTDGEIPPEDKNKIKISDTSNSDEDTPEKHDNSDNLKLLAELQESITRKDEEINNLKQANENKSAIIQKLYAKNVSLNETLASRKNISKKLVSNNRQLQESNTEANNSNDELKAKYEALLQEHSDLQSKFVKLESTNQELSKLFDDGNPLREKLESENSRLKNANNKLRTENKNLFDENQKLSSKIDQLNESIKREQIKSSKRLKESTTLHESDMNTLKRKCNTLQAQNEQLALTNSDLQTQCENLTKTNKDYVNSLAGYISLICNKYNLKEATLYRRLGKSYSFADVETCAKELADNIQKINSLPFADLAPERQVYAENVGLAENNSEAITENLNIYDFLAGAKQQ